MNEMLVAVFDNDDAAEEELNALKKLHQEGGHITLWVGPRREELGWRG